MERTDAIISVIMPVYNGVATIERCLFPLLQMRSRGEVYQVILVNDGSTDCTAELASSLGATVISTGGPHGPASARNRGADAAEGDILWFVDADVVVKPDAARRVLRALSGREFAAVIGSYDDTPSASNFLSQYKNLVHHHYHQNSRGEISSFWAGCGAVRKSAFADVGGFDEVRYARPSIEDIEFGYRLKAAGCQINLVPELQGKHLKAWTFRGLLKTEIRDRAVPWSLLLLSRSDLGGELNLAATERVRALLACLILIALPATVTGFISWNVPGTLLTMAILANLELFAFFYRRNGLLFALGGILFHQIYYLYSMTAYCMCWLVVRCGKPFAARSRLALAAETEESLRKFENPIASSGADARPDNAPSEARPISAQVVGKNR